MEVAFCVLLCKEPLESSSITLPLSFKNQSDKAPGTGAVIQRMGAAHIWREAAGDNEKFFMPQLDWISNKAGDVLVDYIGRYESLSNEFQAVCRYLGRNGAEMPHAKKSRRGDYRGHYDARIHDCIEKWFAEDIRHFAYRFDQIEAQ